MAATLHASRRRTSADVVFDHLYDQIVSLKLLPGSKLSEAEVGARFGLSRQPVRDAFNRLVNLELLLIQPQRATRVRKFSMDSITRGRFIRLAIELETASEAVTRWSGHHLPAFQVNLHAQKAAANNDDTALFQTQDEAFHKLIAAVAEKPFAFSYVRRHQALVDRIYLLNLKDRAEMLTLVEDHEAILDCLSRQDGERTADLLRQHLARIENTVLAVRQSHPEYFQD